MKAPVDIYEVVEMVPSGGSRVLRRFLSIEEATEVVRKLNKQPVTQTSFYVRLGLSTDGDPYVSAMR